LTIPNQPTNEFLATETLARSNPSRSSTNALENLADLKDLGGLARDHFADRLRGLNKYVNVSRFRTLQRVAKANIIAQFGILPLLSDIDVLLRFQKLADERAQELERLRTRGLRRTIALWKGSNTITYPNVTIHSDGVTLRADVIKTTTVTIKGHARWFPTGGYLQADESVRAEARSIVLGNRLDPQNLYDLFPWSWLIDYFTNLGTVIGAANNMSNTSHDAVRIMTHTRTHSVSSNHTTSGSGIYTISCTPFEATSETKTRRIATPTLAARTELLKPAQWSILGSLAVLRGSKPVLRKPGRF
jgi:hypothetical protein